jgi:hypothetical protein
MLGVKSVMARETSLSVAIVLACGIAMASGPAAHADDLWSARQRDWFVTVTGAEWAESRLPEFPYNAVTGNLNFKDAYLVSFGLSGVVLNDVSIPVPFTDSRLTGNSVEIEAQIGTHFGLEDHAEAVADLMLRTGEIPVLGDVHFNLGWANGLSYAIGRPDLERGDSGRPGVNSHHLQYYMGIESEWSFGERPRVHFVTQIHHRSGIYGIISPQRTGSNYIGAGLRIDLQ